MDIKDRLRLEFKNYFQLKGGKLKGKSGYCLLQGGHDRKSASLSFYSETNAKCHGCGFSGDIFDYAQELDSLPNKGSSFFTSTIPHLCDLLNIPFSLKDIGGGKGPDHGELRRMKVREIYRFVEKKMIVDHKKVKDWLSTRNLDWEVVSKYGIGYIKNPDTILEELKRKYHPAVIEASGIDDAYLFKNRVLLTLRNREGIPNGFAGVWLGNYEKDSVPKYMNSRNNLCFEKKHSLYGLSTAKANPGVKLYVVEGYTDVLRIAHAQSLEIQKHGYIPPERRVQAVASMCATLTGEQQELLREFDNVVLAFDGDKSGLPATRKLLSKLPGSRGIIIPGAFDPDDYIRKYGLRKFRQIVELDKLALNLFSHEYLQKELDVTAALYSISKTDRSLHDYYLRILASTSKTDFGELRPTLVDICNQRGVEDIKKLISKIQGKTYVTFNLSIEES